MMDNVIVIVDSINSKGYWKWYMGRYMDGILLVWYIVQWVCMKICGIVVMYRIKYMSMVRVVIIEYNNITMNIVFFFFSSLWIELNCSYSNKWYPYLYDSVC